jgi:hypothetical protein
MFISEQMIVVIFIRHLTYVADVMIWQGNLYLVLAIVWVVPQFFLLTRLSLVKLDLFFSVRKVIVFFLGAYQVVAGVRIWSNFIKVCGVKGKEKLFMVRSVWINTSVGIKREF